MKKRSLRTVDVSGEVEGKRKKERKVFDKASAKLWHSEQLIGALAPGAKRDSDPAAGSAGSAGLRGAGGLWWTAVGGGRTATARETHAGESPLACPGAGLWMGNSSGLWRGQLGRFSLSRF